MDLGEVVERVEAEAPGFYTGLPYHNWRHVLAVKEYALIFIERCRKYDLPVHEHSLLLAVYLHDAFFAVPPGWFVERKSGELVDSREKFSAVFARRYLQEQFGVSGEIANRVYDIIMATHFNVVPQTSEEMLMRAADIANLAGGYEAFSRNWDLLYLEACQMSKETPTPQEFALKTASFLPLYLWLQLRLTPEYYNEMGASFFHTYACANIVQKVREMCREVKVVAEVGPGLLPIVCDDSRFQDADVIYIGIDCNPNVLLPALKRVSAQKAIGSQIGPTYLIPGEAKRLPLLSDMVDCLVYRNTYDVMDVSEITRVLRNCAGAEVWVIETYSPDGPPTEPTKAEDRIERAKRLLTEGAKLEVQQIKKQPSDEFEIVAARG